ncbi:RagB/SusD family nutrient uptake outer membrane protein [Fodinibius salsisoli]|uniref:RagB/SusD family nutrient uptake outer membrane protein n=1 Tax=Fodinibius salsisoli TaxID=2820877 RepID=A0ABT3PQX0_9BACT|nr:RagB/SusD family nutrient uptake outer membrane protein [Fodinibius salsisoli]MCW9708241.1 RagB/SusD family nutrient uptake outer membrane protein [Fodinibius salsisoli]
MFKYRKIFVLVMIAGLFVSCSDLLEEEVHTQVSDSRYSTPDGFNEAVNATYYPLRSFYGTEQGLTATVFGTDTYREGADGGYKYMNRYSNELDSFDYITEWIWQNMYEGINIANTVLARAESGVEGISQEVVTRRSAEARFLRGQYYFILVQMFGAVHLTTEETEGVELEASRTPVPQVYEQIISDLEFAIANLPVEAEQAGRATKPASEHLLARVYLTKATSEAGASGDYQQAADLAETVINDYDFTLLDDFGDVHAVGNEQNAEVIWAVQYSPNPLANESADDKNGNSSHLYFNFPYDQEPGLFRTVEFGRPWRRFRPTLFTTQEMFNIDDRDVDSRYEKSFKLTFRVIDPGTYEVDGVEKDFAEGDTAIWFPGYNMPLEEQQQQDTQVITPEEYNSINFPPLWKHADPNRASVNVTAGSRNWLAFRLAETHLIAAEAYFMMNGAGSVNAIDHLNAVRERAAWPGQEVTMTSRTATALAEDGIDFILDERGRELLGEGFRWFDLVRTDKLLERAKAHNPDVVPPLGNLQEYHKLRPIPQGQIDRTEGGSDSFPQNRGY